MLEISFLSAELVLMAVIIRFVFFPRDLVDGRVQPVRSFLCA